VALLLASQVVAVLQFELVRQDRYLIAVRSDYPPLQWYYPQPIAVGNWHMSLRAKIDQKHTCSARVELSST
jgi:hypothetical protein